MTANPRPTAMDVTAGHDLTGLSCVITGATSGLGHESARALASAGAHVILAARNADALTKSRAQIQSEYPQARTSEVPLDLASLESVRTAAATIAQQAGLPNSGHGIGRNHHVGLDRDLDVGMPVVDRHLADAADDHIADQDRRIRLQRRDIRDFDVVGDGLRPPTHRTGQR